MHPRIPAALERAAVTWQPAGLSVELQRRDPRDPQPDLTPLVGFLGTPILLMSTVIGIHLGTSRGESLRLVATLGGATGLLLGQAIVYAAAVLLDEWTHRRDTCRLEIGPQRIRVRRGRKVLLDAPPGQVTAWNEGTSIELVGLGDHVQLFTARDPELARWLVARIREMRTQARMMMRPAYAQVHALDRILERVHTAPSPSPAAQSIRP